MTIQLKQVISKRDRVSIAISEAAYSQLSSRVHFILICLKPRQPFPTLRILESSCFPGKTILWLSTVSNCYIGLQAENKKSFWLNIEKRKDEIFPESHHRKVFNILHATYKSQETISRHHKKFDKRVKKLQ